MSLAQSAIGRAEGYLELGMFESASEELDTLPDEDRGRAEVLDLRLEICICTKRWDAGEKLASKLADLQPKTDRFWVAWAECTRHLVSNEAARVILYRSMDHGHAHSGLVHCKLAYLWEEAGEMERARPHYLRGVYLDPSLAIAPKGESRFEA